MRLYWTASPSYHQAAAEDHKADLTLTALQKGGIARADFVIDVGCGAGHTLRIARTLNASAKLVGVDPDSSAFLAAESPRDDVHFLQGAGEALPFVDGIASHVISRVALNWMH